MNIRPAGRKTLSLIAGLALGLASIAPVIAQATDAPAQAVTLQDLSSRTWTDARAGKSDDLLSLLKSPPEGNTPELKALKANAESLQKNLAKREEAREKKLAELRTKFDDAMAKEGPDALSDAVKVAVETYMVTKAGAREAFKRAPRIMELIKKAEKAAHEAEARGDWFKANELFYRLDLLLEEEGTYKLDKKRLTLRLTMIRLYSPEAFWKLRNDDRIKEKKSPLPPYNGLGENFREKLDGVDAGMVLRAVNTASRQHIDTRPDAKPRVTLKDEMLLGIESMRTLATTSDLKAAFPGLDDKEKTAEFISFLDEWTARLNTPNTVVSVATLQEFMQDALQASERTVRLGDKVVIHEFGNGAMSRLDDFSAIVWPDELARFDRMTQGQFRGVGVQIQLDDETQMIKVVTPLEGTPAQRAGIRSGDLIKKIDGKDAVGISLNQAVDLITGPVDSKVIMTMERKTGEGDDGKAITQEIDFSLARAVIPIISVKGWKRNGAKEDDWDWFIDPASRIGYVRLLQFTEDTTRDLRGAIRQMQAKGSLNGFILDLRFNPGGLLTEAVSVSNTFIDKGTIVSTEGTVPGEKKEATPGESLLKNTPVVVLINEGSASASEIVAGAIRHYADAGEVNAVVIGERSFGKGSVQNVWPLAPNAKMKLTTQYYKLPDGRIIHRKPGASMWGVDPHLVVDMLPETESVALKLRQDADVCSIDEKGRVVCDPKKPTPDPQTLLDDGLDVQLQTALAILQAQAAAKAQTTAARDAK